MEELLGSTLLTKSGEIPTAELLQGKKYIGVYFAAHWYAVCTCSAVAPVPHECVAYTRTQDSTSNDTSEGTFLLRAYHRCPPCRAFMTVLSNLYEE
jgi:hypothetical protein